jgi:hypothetical protein
MLIAFLKQARLDNLAYAIEKLCDAGMLQRFSPNRDEWVVEVEGRLLKINGHASDSFLTLRKGLTRIREAAVLGHELLDYFNVKNANGDHLGPILEGVLQIALTHNDIEPLKRFAREFKRELESLSIDKRIADKRLLHEAGNEPKRRHFTSNDTANANNWFGDIITQLKDLPEGTTLPLKQEPTVGQFVSAVASLEDEVGIHVSQGVWQVTKGNMGRVAIPDGCRMVAHNHPNTGGTPSPNDLACAKKFGAELIVATREGYHPKTVLFDCPTVNPDTRLPFASHEEMKAFFDARVQKRQNELNLPPGKDASWYQSWFKEKEEEFNQAIVNETGVKLKEFEQILPEDEDLTISEFIEKYKDSFVATEGFDKEVLAMQRFKAAAVALKETAGLKEYVDRLGGETTEYISDKQTLILYAEPLLDNRAAVDMREALTDLLKNNILKGIVIYAEDLDKARILNMLIKEVKQDLRIDLIPKAYIANRGFNDTAEADELRALISYIYADRDIPVQNREDILGVIKGPIKDGDSLVDMLNEPHLRVPVVVFEDTSSNALYSFAEALRRIISTKKAQSKTGSDWLIHLPPIRPENIQRKIDEYKSSLEALVAV